MSVTQWASEMVRGLRTVQTGMGITLRHLFGKPVTMHYPDEKWTMPELFRGLLKVDMEVCAVCEMCARICPVDCITIESRREPGRPGKIATRFEIDYQKCMYCGLCSEPCPTGSIHHTSEFEGADFTLRSMLRHYVTTPVAAYKPKKGPETDPVLAPILERGMTYVGDFAPAVAATAPPAATAAAADE